MTTIATDRKCIAADSKLTWGTNVYTVGKIFRRDDGALFATAGDTFLTDAFEKAMMRNEELELPAAPDFFDGAPAFSAMLLTPDGELYLYDTFFVAYRITDPFAAIGTGEDVALSWMKHGQSPAVAVERACEVCDSSGGAIQIVHLHPIPSPARKQRAK